MSVLVSLHLGKWYRNGTIATKHNANPHKGLLQADPRMEAVGDTAWF